VSGEPTPEQAEVLDAITEVEREHDECEQRAREEITEVRKRRGELLLEAQVLGLRPSEVARALNEAYREPDEPDYKPTHYSPQGVASMIPARSRQRTGRRPVDNAAS
jgi:hypothetical protein